MPFRQSHLVLESQDVATIIFCANTTVQTKLLQREPL